MKLILTSFVFVSMRTRFLKLIIIIIMKNQLLSFGSKTGEEGVISSSNSLPTNDVSFSVPEWRHQEIKIINEQYEK